MSTSAETESARQRLHGVAAEYIPGLAAAGLVSLATVGLTQIVPGVPALLAAVLIGALFGGWLPRETFGPGLRFAGKRILRIGVALLGARMTLDDLGASAWVTILGACAVVFGTLLAGRIVALRLGASRSLALVSAGATAICGASAAVAIAAVLPGRGRSQEAVAVVVTVTLVGTVAMIAYPYIALWAGVSADNAGTFLGLSLHEVAQVVGGGYAMAPDVGDTAVAVKMLRVALLVPVTFALWLICSLQGEKRPEPQAVLQNAPWFLLGFTILALAANAEAAPAHIFATLAATGQQLLLFAMAAIGLSIRLRELIGAQRRLLVITVAQTAVAAAIAFTAVVAIAALQN